MTMTRGKTVLLATLVAPAAAALLAAPQSDGRSRLADLVSQLTRESKWTLTAKVPVGFPTFHPQGMVRIGETFFVSSVEVKQATRRFPAPIDGYDRDAGAGVGHLFKFDASGKLLADVILGEGTIYHPGGIDYDGTDIWVPVAEYRPNSKSIVYRVDPQSMKATEVFRWADHIGGVVHDTEDQAPPRRQLGIAAVLSLEARRQPSSSECVDGGKPQLTMNPSHYVDYQDCKYAGQRRMLCTGVADLRPSPGAAPFRLGGLDLDRPARRPAAAPGARTALDAEWSGHDAQPDVVRGHERRPARLLHARRQHVDGLCVRGARSSSQDSRSDPAQPDEHRNESMKLSIRRLPVYRRPNLPATRALTPPEEQPADRRGPRAAPESIPRSTRSARASSGPARLPGDRSGRPRTTGSTAGAPQPAPPEVRSPRR